jgi:uncharacterized RDD family membrane protein YckC
MDTNFKDVMSERTDEELIKIITIDRNNYQPIAIEAAEEEIRTRDINTGKIELLKSDLENQLERKRELDSKKVNPLKRFIHFVVDTLICWIIIALLFFGIELLMGTGEINILLKYLVILTGFFGYYVFMETKYQRTIGKFITNSIVVTSYEDVPDLKRIFTRTICRLIPFDLLSFLFTNNGFHDRFSSTMLINNKKTFN